MSDDHEREHMGSPSGGFDPARYREGLAKLAPPVSAPAMSETEDPDVKFLVNYVTALRSHAERSRRKGQIFGPECVDVQAPIFDRIIDRLRRAAATREGQ